VLLVLDEATAALDETTEERVIESLVGLTGSMALVMVSHRASVLERCRRIIRIENGHLEELVSRESREGSRGEGPVSTRPPGAGPESPA
jgi:ATP-binding cassette subfamily C protein